MYLYMYVYQLVFLFNQTHCVHSIMDTKAYCNTCKYLFNIETSIISRTIYINTKVYLSY